MPRLLLHHIDVINEEYISGWCFHRIIPRHSLRLEFQLGTEPIGHTFCNKARDDVQRAGLHATGSCGFEFIFPRHLDLSGDGEFRATCFNGLIPVFKIAIKSVRSVLRPERPVFFVHIPKTAGTSFNNHVHPWFGYGKWHSHIEVLDLATQRKLINPGHYIAGHIPLYKLREIEPDFSKLDLHTIFRHPIDQLHSHLAWLKGIGTNPDSGFFKTHQPVIQELSLRMQGAELNYASGVEKFIASMEGFQFEFFDNIQTRYLLDSRPARVSNADLNRAFDNLSAFKTFGTTEHYQDYLDLCARYYQQKTSIQSTRHNPAKVAALFDKTDPSILHAIDPLICYDNRLYQHILDSRT
ncbi:MAG: hypothetical protein P8Y12_06360 [Gammaproteobacteria bacterium]